MVLTRRGGTSFLRTCISCIQSNPQTVPAFNRTCRQYLRHLPSVPASPANATGESTNAVYRVVSDMTSSGACIECIPANKPASESPQHTIPPNSRSSDSYSQNLYSIQVFWPISRRHDDHDTCVRMHTTVRDYPQQRSLLIVSVAFKPARR